MPVLFTATSRFNRPTITLPPAALTGCTFDDMLRCPRARRTAHVSHLSRLAPLTSGTSHVSHLSRLAPLTSHTSHVSHLSRLTPLTSRTSHVSHLSRLAPLTSFRQPHERAVHAANVLLQQQVPRPLPVSLLNTNSVCSLAMTPPAKPRETLGTRPLCLSNRALKWSSRWGPRLRAARASLRCFFVVCLLSVVRVHC